MRETKSPSDAAFIVDKTEPWPSAHSTLLEISKTAEKIVQQAAILFPRGNLYANLISTSVVEKLQLPS